MKKKKKKTDQTRCFFFKLQVQRALWVTLGSKGKWETEDSQEKRVNEEEKL